MGERQLKIRPDQEREQAIITPEMVKAKVQEILDINQELHYPTDHMLLRLNGKKIGPVLISAQEGYEIVPDEYGDRLNYKTLVLEAGLNGLIAARYVRYRHPYHYAKGRAIRHLLRGVEHGREFGLEYTESFHSDTTFNMVDHLGYPYPMVSRSADSQREMAAILGIKLS